MFVRVRKQPGKNGPIPYAYLVNNEWNTIKKKHEQKIIASMGRLTDLPIDGTIEKMISALDRFAKTMGWATLSNGIILSDLSDETILSKTKEWGSFFLTRHSVHTLSLDAIFSSCYAAAPKKVTREIAKDRFLATMTAILARRLYPRTDASERSTHAWYEKDVFGTEKESLSLMDFYRTLDVLIDQKDAIERSYYEKNLTLFNGKLDLVLFDTTSIYYWGSQENGKQEDLLQYGFSKDGKGNLKQLIVGVLMTSDGIPIAHEVFAGNTSDVTSFRRIITVIKEKYKLEKIILIADRGMVSEQNLLTLEQSGFSYVVGIRMRQMPNQLKQKLLVPLDEDSVEHETDFMDKSADNLYVREFPVSAFSDTEIQEFFLKKIKQGKLATTTFDEKELIASIHNRRFFICVNPFVKEATKKKREYFTKIIEKKIKTTPTKEWIVKNGYKKYLKFDKGLSPTIDYDRLTDEELYDGKWIIMTNEKTISSYTAGTYYKTLQTIERGFRDLKSLITVQPIFHFTERRMRAHIFTCFLSLIIKWYICRMINKYSQEEGRRFIEEMIALKAIAVDETIPVFVRTALSKDTQETMGKLGMKIPGKVIVDGRKKLSPVSHKPGRPRNDRSTGQLSIS